MTLKTKDTPDNDYVIEVKIVKKPLSDPGELFLCIENGKTKSQTNSMDQIEILNVSELGQI